MGQCCFEKKNEKCVYVQRTKMFNGHIIDIFLSIYNRLSFVRVIQVCHADFFCHIILWENDTVCVYICTSKEMEDRPWHASIIILLKIAEAGRINTIFVQYLIRQVLKYMLAFSSKGKNTGMGCFTLKNTFLLSIHIARLFLINLQCSPLQID